MNNILSKKVKLLGFTIDALSMPEALECSVNLIKSRKGGQVVTINPEMIQFAKSNPDFDALIKSADLILPDGVGIKIGLKLNKENVERIAGIEYAFNMLKECADNKIPVALVGARPHVISEAVRNLICQIPGLKIVYQHNGYFSDDDRVIAEMKRNVPKFILVAIGSPRQELFIQKARKELPSALMVGVGGSFDVWSGHVKRAPMFYQKCGLEWLYRTVKEPQRFKRIFPTLPNFMLRVIKEDVLKK